MPKVHTKKGKPFQAGDVVTLRRNAYYPATYTDLASGGVTDIPVLNTQKGSRWIVCEVFKITGYTVLNLRFDGKGGFTSIKGVLGRFVAHAR